MPVAWLRAGKWVKSAGWRSNLNRRQSQVRTKTGWEITPGNGEHTKGLASPSVRTWRGERLRWRAVWKQSEA